MHLRHNYLREFHKQVLSVRIIAGKDHCSLFKHFFYLIEGDRLRHLDNFLIGHVCNHHGHRTSTFEELFLIEEELEETGEGTPLFIQFPQSARDRTSLRQF